MSKYGEPWAANTRVPTLIYCEDGDTASFGGHHTNAVEPDVLVARQEAKAARAVACVNALAGIDDPQAAIDAAREALDGVFSGHTDFAAVAKAVRLLGEKSC